MMHTVATDEPEEDTGASPGMDGFPVFETDKGTVGMITCYESWFVDPIRILALRGADLVLFSSEGVRCAFSVCADAPPLPQKHPCAQQYFPALMTARAADNGVWLVAASGDPAHVWDSSGHQGGEPDPDGISAPSSILAFNRSKSAGMITATLDLTQRFSPAWWGGPMRSAPGGRRVRYSGARKNDLDVTSELSRWWAKSDDEDTEAASLTIAANDSIKQRGGLQPSVYWVSTPTLFNETLLISGAGLEGARVSLCAGKASNCSELGPSEVSSWAHSVKLVLPAWCGPPCSVAIAAPGAQAITLAANRPDVWWAASDWPLGPDSPIGPSIAPVVHAGGTLRVFGRGLAWAEDGSCIDSAAVPGPVQTTTLTLKGPTGVATAAVPSHAASCYEAAFEMPVGQTGRLKATLSTPWGRSIPFVVVVPPPAPAPTPLPPTVIDVLEDCGGDLALAMRKAAAAAHGATVVLGAHTFSMAQPLAVPDRTTIQGKSPDESLISFVLASPNASSQWPLHAAVAVGSGVELNDFAISLAVAVPQTEHPQGGGHWRWRSAGPVALLMPENTTEFRADGLRLTTAGNASNVLRLEGAGFAVTDCELRQDGCTLSEGFQPSSALLMSNARDGLFAENRILWSCSAFDLDTSERVIFERNDLVLNVAGTIPHGNSVSGYGSGYGAGWPLNRWWSFLRNNFSRPPCSPAAPGQCGGTNWEQRETWTTDNSHAAGVGYVAKQASLGKQATVEMKWVAWSATPQPGTTLAVVNGSGMGQLRLIVGVVDNTTLAIESPFDDHLAPDSFVVVVNTYDKKLLAGNHFDFTEVIQFFGVTLGGVIADNHITDGNVNHSQHTRDPVARKYGGSMRAVGECYHGPAPLFGLEYLGNHFVRSDGIFLQDNHGPADYQCGGPHGFLGPWIRWAAVRRNSFSGVSLAAKAHADPPACGAVVLTGASSDIVAEHDVFECEGGAVPGGYEGDLAACERCTFRP